MNDFIILSRDIFKNPLYFSEPFTKIQAWIDLVLLAENKDAEIHIRGITVNVKRGQIAISQDTLAERWKWSRGKVIRFLNGMEMVQQIVQQKNRIIGLISIVYYNDYSINDTTNSTTNSTTENPVINPISNKDNPSEKIIISRIPFEEIMNAWNKTCISYPRLISLSESRKTKIRLRLKEMGDGEKGMQVLKDIFTKLESSKFLKGDNKNGWKATFDWIITNDKNWVKVYEGNYKDHEEKKFNDNNINDLWK